MRRLVWPWASGVGLMQVFIDTEFTDHARPDLISIGLAVVDSDDFYAGRTDYRREECSSFVVVEVIPLLGRVAGASCTAEELAGRLRNWFQALPEPAKVVFDYKVDWQRLQAAFRDELPANLTGHQLVDHKMFQHSAYKLGEVLTYTSTLPEHQALADARALREGFLRWTARSAKQGDR